MARNDELVEAALSAYRTAEPRRRRDPFADARLTQIAGERAARAATPWYRRLLVTHPAPAFVTSALALALLVLPGGAPATIERSAAPLVMADMNVASPTPAVAAPMGDAAAPDLLPALLATAAVAGALEGVRRLRAARG